MKTFITNSILLVVLVLTLTSCNHAQVTPSFYYWKSTFRLTEAERDYLHQLGIQKLYLRLFDIDWNTSDNKPVPIAVIQFADSVPTEFTIVPVVFISNKALINSNKDSIPVLSNHLFQKINEICNRQHINYKELQLDCDWTDQSKEKYLELLRCIGQKVNNEQFISVTIRLHQIKYSALTGVPPVKRGMLMFYNMGTISTKAGYNSIYNKDVASLYTNSCKHYPLPLDVALPAFSWGIQIRNNKVIRLLDNFASSMLCNESFELISGNYYKSKNSFFFRGFYFMKDDMIKIEECGPELTFEAAKQLSSCLNKQNRSVSIFHCDSIIFKRYEKNDLSKIYHCFR